MASIQGIYIALFGRPADPIGLQYWNGVTNNGADLSRIVDLASTAEYQDRFAGMNNTQIVNSIYQSLFGRDADLAGLTFFVNGLQNGTYNINNIAISILDAAQGSDAAILANKEAAANAFTASIDTTAEVLAYSGNDAAQDGRNFLANITAEASTVPSQQEVDAAIKAIVDDAPDGTVGETFTLTTGVDAPGAAAPAVDTAGGTGNDVYNAILVNDGTAAAASGSTLQVSDLINAGAGTDTLNVTVTGGAGVLAQALPVSSGLEKVHARNLATGGVTLDATLAAGLTEVGNTSSTGAVAFTGVGSNATVRVADSSAATSVEFADKVFQNGGTASISVKNAGTSTTDAAITLSTAAAAGTATTLAIAAEGKNYIDLAGGTKDIAAANGIKTITVSGSGSLDLDSSSELVGTTLAADVTKLDASANTGGVTATVENTKVAVTGGSGADVITVGGALVEGASINLGAGNDSLLQTGAGAIGSKVTVDGGAGVDAISTAFINAGNGSQFLNFERLDLAAGTLDASLLTGSTITDLVLSGAGGTTINNVKAGVDLIVSSTTAAGTTNINVADATKAGNTSDVFDINFAGAAVSGAAATAANVKAGTIALAGVETVNIASDGGANTWNSITLTDDAAKVINITGAKNLDLTVTDQTFAPPATDQALATVDASAATGNIKLVMGGAFDGTIKTGSGNDFIDVGNATTITTGGGKDVIDVRDAAGASEIVTITDFVVKTDKIQFSNIGSETFSATKVDVSTATTLAQALDLAAAGDGGTNAAVTWFQYAGDTYVVQDTDAGATFAATDHAVKLTGLVDLSTLTVSDFNFA